MITKVDTLFIYVEDEKRANKFYKETLGLKEFLWQGQPIGYEINGIYLMFLKERPQGETQGGTEVCFFSDDINKDYEQLKAKGVKFLLPPTQQEWGGILAKFLDSEGNALYLTHYQF
jgi:predicted enzyme related to lactoylglutathione lyase